jgi:hypothetical protein
MQGHKRTLFYSMIANEINVPVLEFVSSSHTSDTLSYLMKRFLSDVRLVNGGRSVQARHIVTDFSYAILNSVLDAFNHQTLKKYLHYCFELMKGTHPDAVVRHTTHLALCIAHMFKALSNRLKSMENNRFRRRKVLVLLAVMTTTVTLEQASLMYKHVYTVLCSPNVTEAVENSLLEIDQHLQKLSTTDLEFLEAEENACEQATLTSETGNNYLKRRSTTLLWLPSKTHK